MWEDPNSSRLTRHRSYDIYGKSFGCPQICSCRSFGIIMPAETQETKRFIVALSSADPFWKEAKLQKLSWVIGWFVLLDEKHWSTESIIPRSELESVSPQRIFVLALVGSVAASKSLKPGRLVKSVRFVHKIPTRLSCRIVISRRAEVGG